MKRNALQIGCLAAASAAAVLSEQPANQLATFRKEWVINVNTRQLDRVMTLYAEDSVLVAGSGERIVGRSNISTYFKKMFERTTADTLGVEYPKGEISGDFGYDSGAIVHRLAVPAGSENPSWVMLSGNECRGNYLSVLRRQAGKWVIIQQAFNDTCNMPRR
jgi:ketosteroid isomerase-like protein